MFCEMLIETLRYEGKAILKAATIYIFRLATSYLKKKSPLFMLMIIKYEFVIFLIKIILQVCTVIRRYLRNL